MPYPFNAVTALFWIVFIYSVFFAGESLILVKNVEVAFEIKPRHPISRGNMSVDQSFLVHCSRRSSYFPNFRWCVQSMLVTKGIVNSAMITFFLINWPNDEIWTLASWCYFRWKIELSVYVSNNVPVRATIKQCWCLCLLFLCGVFETFLSLTNCIFVFIHKISLAVSQHIFAISAIIPKISLCLNV